MTNKQMEQNIKEYGDSIITIENFVEAVRQIPGNYIGPLNNRGFLNMFREVYQNSIDELIKAKSPCDHIIVSFDERTKTVIVEDNGRGIPFDIMIRVFTTQHTSSNYEKELGDYSSGLHGLGAKVTNALSTSFDVKSFILGKAKEVRMIEGHPWNKGVIDIDNEGKQQGTRITFTPSFEIMGEITTNMEDILWLVKSILWLTPIGSVVYFNGIFLDGSEYHEKIVNTNGVMDHLSLKIKSPLIKPIIISKDTGYMKADIAFTFDLEDTDEGEDISGFANTCPTVQGTGTHVEGFLDGVCKFFKNYMNKIFLTGKTKNKITVNNTDVKSGLKGVVSTFHLKPNFTGQAKEILSNPDLHDFVRDLVCSALEDWSKTNPNDLQKTCNFLKEIAKFRIESEEGKTKIAKKYESDILTGLPAKFIKPKGKYFKDPLELIIVEGDSAGGSARNHKNNDLQGIMPIRGKLPNALSVKKSKFLANQEIQGLISIIQGGYGKNFDINKVPWQKIIFMSDADPDGDHIATLLLKFVLKYMPALIEHGRVYKAVPPLYGIKEKGKYVYFTTKLDYVEYVQDLFSKENEISTLRGNKLDKLEIINLLYNNINYVYELEKIATRYSLEPKLLELVLCNKDIGFEKLKSLVKSKYRFMDVTKQNGTIFVEGLLNSKIQTMIFNDKLLDDSKNILDIISKVSSIEYIVNGEVNTLYDLMKKFEVSSPKNLTRYKGLGEMDGKQLAESTLLPNGNRTLIRYTTESAIKELNILDYLESNKQEIVKDQIATRRDLLG